jgi:hypothetical protein
LHLVGDLFELEQGFEEPVHLLVSFSAFQW